MNELEGVALLVRAIHFIGTQAFVELRRSVVESALVSCAEIEVATFDGLPDKRIGVGIEVFLLARRLDGGSTRWTVDLWIDDWAHDGVLRALVKGDIEAVDALGASTNLFDEVRSSVNSHQAAEDLARCAQFVVSQDVGLALGSRS
jgi:hypothetical protein